MGRFRGGLTTKIHLVVGATGLPIGPSNPFAQHGHADIGRTAAARKSTLPRALQEIWMAETRNHADSAFDAFIETYAVKYDKAAACLVKDRETMLAFYDFPAEHWKHLRSNVDPS